MAPDATVPEVAPDQNLTDTETMAPENDADTMATDQGAATGDVAATDEVYIGEQATEEDLASNWIGQSLYNANDENLGDINDILIGDDGAIKAVIVGVGGFLGIGEKDVAVSLRAIEPRTDEDGDVTLYLNATPGAARGRARVPDPRRPRGRSVWPTSRRRSIRPHRRPSPHRSSSRPAFEEATSPPGSPAGSTSFS